MEKNYNFKEVEKKLTNLWDSQGCFAVNHDKSKKSYTVILPPPNANGDLHLGHALYTVEDIMIRYKRMSGFNALWIPGEDHAGFETQVVYEKYLSTLGKSRFDFSREEFYQNIFEFVQKNKTRMQNQLKSMGFSFDWSRETFTLDPKVIKIVYSTFEKLNQDSLLYRGERLVNYCTIHETSFSDLEIEYKEKDGNFYFVKYQLEGTKDFLTVATVRPETIFVDVCLAVNPSDERYKNFIGKKVINPLTKELIPIIEDEYVDIELGTGVLKVTPLHDFNDYNLAKKHGIENYKSVIEKNGRLNDLALEFAGMKVNASREKIAEKLQQEGLIEKIVPHKNSVPCCYKCSSVLEPMLIPQWFIKTKPLALKAKQAVIDGKIKFHPKRFEDVYFEWLDKIIDWNISRQIVWGIRIPAFECQVCKNWQIAIDLKPKKCECGSDNFKQDEDTFDTWFSSGQWPFATLGYPDSEDFKNFYPTSMLDTAYDILFFWVARMVMLGIYVTGEVPFENIYLHGLVRDAKGQKMSKSKGNVINPLDLIEKYGVDSVRMSLIMGTPAGNDQNFSESKYIGNRNFANKVWNMARYIEFSKPEGYDLTQNYELKDLENLDYEIAKTHKEFIANVTSKLDSYKLSDAAEEVFSYIWHYVADTLIEKAKTNKELFPLLNLIFKDCLKVLSVFMPFVTEEVWQNIYTNNQEKLVSTSSWPKY